MKDLRITTVQSPLVWEDASANCNDFSALLDEEKPQTDLIVLPEMFNTGFSMRSDALAESMAGPTVQWMRETAAKHDAVLCGSLIIGEGGHFYNRLIWMRPDGSFEQYDKRHLFRMAGEDGHFSAGSERLIVELKGWRIFPLVCYDLRFPVWSRNRSDYDVLIYIANWPEVRSAPWKKLLLARAIENQAYVVGVNRVGEDGKGISYSGDSVVIDAKGEPISNTQPGETKVETVDLSWQALADFREKFPVALDADDFELR